MNATEVQSLIWGLMGGVISIVGTAIAVSNWLNNKFDILKTRQQEAESRLQIQLEKLKAGQQEAETRLQLQLEKLKGSSELESTREISHWDMLEYKTNANRELIEHRTRRFHEDLKAVEARLTVDINEVKAFLEKTTEFQIRNPRQRVEVEP